MSQNDFNLANQGFPSMREDMNSALQALATNSSGATDPSTTYAYQWWYDTATNILKVRNAANTAWINFASFDQGTGQYSPYVSGVALTATGAELNILDGVTATAAELNILDGANVTTATSLLANPKNYLDPENRIINGAFDFWQRGTSFTTGTYLGYTADRWYLDRLGGFASVERINETLGVTLGSNSPKYFIRTSVASQTLPSHTAYLENRIEGVRSYQGQTITVLGWARRVSGAGDMLIKGFQLFGTGGSPSSPTTTNDVTVTLSTNWQPFAATLVVPSIAGKVLGNDGNDYLSARFYVSDGSSIGVQTIGVDLWGIHIKLGTHTTDAVNFYKAPEIGPELARCQRYYEIGQADPVGQGSNSLNFSGNVTSGSPYVASCQYKVQKRAYPTATLTNIFGNGFPSASGNSYGGIGGIIEIRNASATLNGARFISSFTADAEL